MRILAIQPFLRGWTIGPLAGGKNRAAYLVAREMVRNGHEIFVLPWWGERVAEETPFKLGPDGEEAIALPTLTTPPLREVFGGMPRLGAQIIRYRDPRTRIPRYLDRLPFDQDRALGAAMERARPDVVHVHQTYSNVAEVYRRGGYEAPLLLTHYTRGLADTIPLFDEVVFVSRYQRDAAARKYPELTDRFRVVHISVGDEFMVPLSPEPSRTILVVAVMGTPGEEHHQKGIDLLLESLVQHPSLRRFNVVIVGEGVHRPYYQGLSEEHQLPVEFLGRLSMGRLVEQFQCAGSFVLPSRGEGLATTYLEALCMGLPIVGFPPNVEELAGVLDMPVGEPYDAQEGDLRALADSIEAVMDPEGSYDVEHRRELGRRARASFRRERFYELHHALYRDMSER